MQVGTWELKLDPRFSRLLRPGSRELEDPAVQTLEALFAAVASGMGLDSPNGPWREGLWQVSGLGEALIRARLLNVERLLAASHLDQARQTLNAVPKDPGLAELSSWAADLNRRLEEVHSKPPLMATGVRKVGAIMSLPKALHEEDHPVLFWRRTQLCVKQEQSKPPRMRCVEARTGGWGKEEPYRSPYGRWQVELEYQGARRYNMTRVVSDGPEASPSEDDEWYEPVVVARGKGGRLVVVSQKDPLQHSELENLELATGPGSLLAGGGKYYFSKPDELRSLEVAGLAWKFVVPAPGGEVRCAAPPRVSPNGQWAACPAAPGGAEGTPEAKKTSRFDLLLFRLTPPAP